MKHLTRALRVGFLSMALLLPCVIPSTVHAETGETSALIFREIKMKGEDFAVLVATRPTNLHSFWLASDGDPTAVPNPEEQLPNLALDEGDVVLLVGGEMVPLCDADYVMDIPVAFNETGSAALWEQTVATDTELNFILADSVSWGTSKPSNVDILRLNKEDKMALPTWFRDLDHGSTDWHVGSLWANDTEWGYETATQAPLVTQPLPEEKTGPVFYENQNEVNSTPVENGIPGENTDLAAPQITEILPNPKGTGTDGTEEFIELYNPNSVAFILTGYTLRSGIATTHTYAFPEGTTLAPGSFTSFSVTVTDLTLSNSSGQASLLDADGAVVARTDPYSSAPDGQAWALGDGEWMWTTVPTPGMANVITETAKVLGTSTAAKTTKTAKITVAKAKTTKTATVKKTSAKKTTAKTAKAAKSTAKKAANLQERPVRGIHPLVLALVAVAAVGYGVYEYRHDVANAIYRFRSNRAARRAHRS